MSWKRHPIPSRRNIILPNKEKLKQGGVPNPRATQQVVRVRFRMYFKQLQISTHSGLKSKHNILFSSVQSLSCVQLFAIHEPQHARPPCPSPTARVYPNSCPLTRWCHPTISSSVVPFSSCPQSFPTSGFFPMSQLFPSGGQGIGASASTSVFPMNTQDWSPLGWTGWISLQSKGLSRVFSNTTVQKHQFLSAQLSL